MKLVWILVLIPLVLLAGCVENLRDLAPQLLGPSDLHERLCMEAFKECKRVFEAKSSYDVTLNDFQKFDDKSGTESYFDKWSSGRNYLYDSSIKQCSFPAVLFAVSGRSPNPYTLDFAVVLFCDSHGRLVESSRNSMDCG